MTNHRTIIVLRSILAQLDAAAWSLQRSADVAAQFKYETLSGQLEAKGDELLTIRTSIENDLRDLEAQAANETKGQ